MRRIFHACGHQLLIPFAGFNGFNRCCGIAFSAFLATLVNLFLLPSANLLICFQASGDLLLQVSCVLLLYSSIQRNFLAAEHHLLVLLLSFNGFIGAAVYRILGLFSDFGKFIFLPSANFLFRFQASRDFLLQVSCVFCSAPLFRGIFLACGHRLLIPFAGFNGFNRCCGIAFSAFLATLVNLFFCRALTCYFVFKPPEIYSCRSAAFCCSVPQFKGIFSLPSTIFSFCS